ncbi:hypothetical protein E2562_034858 [Oryza meyeriana var. granulata]|uniref:Uncharacterized protein n=1 Tax=Oryza meyeriana var. granulata TaxID=110450 RepID=A0A6G1E5M4_9ORYZ|nr:hypothetical protein E2562_034858 [Oryza meyeriana var. granulata]
MASPSMTTASSVNDPALDSNHEVLVDDLGLDSNHEIPVDNLALNSDHEVPVDSVPEVPVEDHSIPFNDPTLDSNHEVPADDHGLDSDHEDPADDHGLDSDHKGTAASLTDWGEPSADDGKHDEGAEHERREGHIPQPPRLPSSHRAPRLHLLVCSLLLLLLLVAATSEFSLTLSYSRAGTTSCWCVAVWIGRARISAVAAAGDWRRRWGRRQG